jgi:RHS repeat-associated protein
VYDALNRVAEETNQLSFTRYFVYDAAGNLTRRTDRNGRVIEYTYDNLYRRTQENWLDEYETSVRTIDWTFDAAGQLTAASDLAADYTYTYDALGRATTLTHDIVGLGSQVIMNHTFDALGNRTQLAATIGGTADFVTEYTYDALRRMTRIQQHGVSGGNAVAEKRIDLTYDAASQWQSITRYADLAATKVVATSAYTFDAVGRMTSLDHSQGSTSLAGYSWQYDAGSRVTQFVSLLDGTVDYNYDNTNQLTGAAYSAGAGLPTAPPDESYAYDANGNRTITGYVTGPNNQLLSDGTYDYEYDNEGNRTLRTNIATGETTEYQWDHRNRLIKITDRDDTAEITQTAEYTYDFQNRRIAKSLSTLHSPLSTTYYLYDGNRWQRGNAGDHIALQFNADGNLTNRYLYGPAVDQILADEQLDELLGPTSSGDVLWPLTDNLGTVRDIAEFDDVTGITSVANHIVYNAFGQIISETNQDVDHRYAFTGRERDDESGLNYYRERFYDPRDGRFLNEDLSGFPAGDANLNRYTGNRPIDRVDPSGWRSLTGKEAFELNRLLEVRRFIEAQLAEADNPKLRQILENVTANIRNYQGLIRNNGYKDTPKGPEYAKLGGACLIGTQADSPFLPFADAAMLLLLLEGSLAIAIKHGPPQIEYGHQISAAVDAYIAEISSIVYSSQTDPETVKKRLDELENAIDELEAEIESKARASMEQIRGGRHGSGIGEGYDVTKSSQKLAKLYEELAKLKLLECK